MQKRLKAIINWARNESYVCKFKKKNHLDKILKTKAPMLEY